MFPDLKSDSGQLYRRAVRVMPGGNTRTSLWWPPHEIYARSAAGTRVVDVDGVERTDFQFNFTVLIHGHAHPEIVRRVQAQAANMLCVSMATESEVALAELICARVPSVDRVRFTNSGTEAVLAAIKAARAYTGRPKVAKCEGLYHGTCDIMETSNSSTPDRWGPAESPAAVPMSRGTPQGVLEDVVVLPYNNLEASRRLLEIHENDLAAVVFDPMPVRSGYVQARPDYVAMLRDATRSSGALLVSDEVLTFRLGYHGAQVRFGYEPDLTVFGKIIGGGLPIGAVGGRAEVMSVFDPREGFAAWHGGTFNGNPMSTTAGLACMELLEPDAFGRLEALGEQARRRVREAFEAAGVPGRVTGAGSLLRIHCTAREFSDYRSFHPLPDESDRLQRLMLYLMNHGFLVSRMGAITLSTVTTEDEIDAFGETLYEGLCALAAADAATS